MHRDTLSADPLTAAFDAARQAAGAGEVPVGASVARAGRICGGRRQPRAARSRSDRSRRNSGDSRGVQGIRTRTTCRLRPLRHAGALRHVRRGDLAGAHSPTIFRSGGRKGGRRRTRPALLLAADLPSCAGCLRGAARERSRAAAAGFLLGATLGGIPGPRAHPPT